MKLSHWIFSHIFRDICVAATLCRHCNNDDGGGHWTAVTELVDIKFKIIKIYCRLFVTTHTN